MVLNIKILGFIFFWNLVVSNKYRVLKKVHEN